MEAGRGRRGQERRHFVDEFKTEAVALLASSGRLLVRIAGELGISLAMLRNRAPAAQAGMRGRRRIRNWGRQRLVPAPRMAISRLCRADERVRLERGILRRRWRFSRNRRDEVPPDRGSPGCLAGAGHVQRTERVALRLLCLAITAGERAQDRRAWAAGRYPAGSCPAPGTVWGAPRIQAELRAEGQSVGRKR